MIYIKKNMRDKCPNNLTLQIVFPCMIAKSVIINKKHRLPIDISKIVCPFFVLQDVFLFNTKTNIPKIIGNIPGPTLAEIADNVMFIIPTKKKTNER